MEPSYAQPTKMTADREINNKGTVFLQSNRRPVRCAVCVAVY